MLQLGQTYKQMKTRVDNKMIKQFQLQVQASICFIIIRSSQLSQLCVFQNSI